MGFLSRLFGGGGRKASLPGAQSWPPPGPITSWPVGESFTSKFPAAVFLPKNQAVVGVLRASRYQGALELIAGGRTLDGLRSPNQVAMLLPEPSNAADPNGVRVVVIPRKPGRPWGKVGYLSREDAEQYRPVIERVAALGKVTACHAVLAVGPSRGADGPGHIGVALLLDMPEKLMLVLDKELKV
jgi:hypothetical protein